MRFAFPSYTDRRRSSTRRVRNNSRAFLLPRSHGPFRHDKCLCNCGKRSDGTCSDGGGSSARGQCLAAAVCGFGGPGDGDGGPGAYVDASCVFVDQTRMCAFVVGGGKGRWWCLCPAPIRPSVPFFPSRNANQTNAHRCYAPPPPPLARTTQPQQRSSSGWWRGRTR